MKVAIIDPVGVKSGMNHYNNGLCQSLSRIQITPYIYSNYTAPSNDIQSRSFFGTFFSSKWMQTLDFIRGIILSVIDCKKNNIKTAIVHVFSTHHMAFLTYLIVKIAGLKIITISHDVSSFTNQDNWLYHRFIYNRCSSHIVVHNDYSKDHLLPLISPKAKASLSVIKHGSFIDLVDQSVTASYARTRLNLKPDRQYLLFFGRLKPTKRLDILLEAMPKIDPDIHLIIAGKPIKNNFKSYQQRIEELGISHRVVLDIDYISDEKREWYFKGVNAMVLPYEVIFQSGVLLMSMSYGLPVIASNIPPFKEVVQHQQNGLLFESLKVDGLACTINDLMADESLQSVLSEGAKWSMKNDYSWETIASKYAALIATV